MILKKSVSKRSLRFASSLLVLAVLAACGGGGGGGDPVAGTPAPAPSPTPSPSPSPSPSPDPAANQPPVASLAYTPASPNLLTIATPITLNATSTDPESNSLTHSWTLVSRPTGSSAALNQASGASVTFTPDRSGIYLVSITSSDGTSSATAQSSLEVVNRAPTASLGYNGTAPTTVTAGSTLVSLRATSTDADNETLTHTWSLTRPAGDSSTALSATTGATTTFTPGVAGTYSVRVSSSDGTTTTQSAPFSITVVAAASPPPPPPPPPPNTAPTASLSRTAPGPSGTPVIGSPVTYSATSTDDGLPSGSSLTHAWTLTRPAGSAVATSGTGASFSYTPDRPGTYAVSLVSSDGALSSTAATAAVTVVNRAPTAGVALASTQSATVAVGERVSLVSTGADADGQTLTHTWSIVRPAGDTTTALTSTTGAANTFRPTATGTYTIGISTTDGIDTTAVTSALSITVGAQPTEVACSVATSTPTVFRFQQPALVAPSTNPRVSVGTLGTTSAAETQGNAACFHQTVLRDVSGLDQAFAQGGYYYFEATRTGPAHIGVAGAGAPTAGSLGEVTWPADTGNRSFVLSPCDAAVNVNAPGCLMNGYDAGSTPRTVGFAVDYRGNYPIVYVIGEPTDRGDIPSGCRDGSALRSSCVIASRALNVTGAVTIYAYGQTAGGVTGRVVINGGESATYAIGANAARDALRRYRYEAGRGFDSPRWPRTFDGAALPTLATISRGSPVNTVIRLGDAAPFRGALTVTAPGATSVTWRNAAGATIGTGASLTLHTAGSPIAGLAAGDNRIEAVATIGQMTASVSYTVRFAPAAPAADEDWDGDGVLYEAEKTALTDPANPDTDGNGIADGLGVSPIGGLPAVALVHTPGVASPGAVLSDNNLAAAFTSQINPVCQAQAAAGSYAGLSSEICNKRGVLASSGVPQGTFRYYEVRKRAPNATATIGPNMGAGVIVAGAVNPGTGATQWGMDPYGYTGATLDPQTPYSASFNFAANVFSRLVAVPGSSLTGADSEYVGILVDYRGSSPVLRFVYNENVAGTPVTPTTRISVPVTIPGWPGGSAFPMVFGHPQSDLEIAQEANFGLKTFFYDTGTRNLRAALTAAGFSGGDIALLQLGVGQHTRPLQP